MKLSIFNPTGQRVAIKGDHQFSGIVIRSLFATRAIQEFPVVSQEHADWLIRSIKVTCPAAQVQVIGDADVVDPVVVPVVAEVAPITAPDTAELTDPVSEQAPVGEEPAKSATRKGGNKSKPIAETKE